MRHVAGAAAPPADPYDADVVILALDRAEETEAAIASALAQSGVSRHVTIVDQGSRPAVLDRLASAVSGRTDATLVSSGTNRGVAGGRNMGSAIGHGRVIVGLDNDAEFADAGTLARAVVALDEEADLAAVGFRIVEHATGRDDMSSWGYPVALLPRAGASFDTVTFVGAGHAIRRSVWEAVGGYDDALFFCWEEYDFCLHAIAQGWRVRYRGDIAVRHRVSAEQRVAWSGNRWFQFVRNRLYVERKWGASWIGLVPRIGGYAIKGLRHGHARSTLRAVTAAMRMPIEVGAFQLPPVAAGYIGRNDRAHRGSLARRLRSEVLGRVAGPQAGLVMIDPNGTGKARHRLWSFRSQ